MSDTTIDDVEAEFARIRREYRGIGEGAWASAKWYAEALVRSRAELQCALKDRTEERDALLADLRKCEQQLIAVTPVTHTSHDARVALVRQAIFTVLDEANPRTPGLAWDFNDDEQRVDFADRVVSFIPSESERSEGNLKDGPHYGKDCPKGKVQVEFVGVDPGLRYSPYGWKPSDHAFIELWVDGQRFRIDAGDLTQHGHEGRRGTKFIHAKWLDENNCPLRCEVTRASNGQVWWKADGESKAQLYFALEDAGKYVKEIIG